MSVVRGRPPGLGRGIIGSIRRYWSSLSAWPAPKSPTNTRSAGLHILVSRKDRSSSPTATSGGGAHFTRSQPPFQNGLLGGRRPPPALLKLGMVADRLAISPRGVRRLIDRKELPVHYIGSSRRVSEDDLARYLAGTRRS